MGLTKMGLTPIVLADPETGFAKRKTIRNIEKFFSPQGEGLYTGIPTVWLRTWGCTNKCRGFGAADPTDPSTFDGFTEDFDPRKEGITEVTDLPVFKTGCDSRHTWDPRYRHLATKETVSEIADQLIELMKGPFNPDGSFYNSHSDTWNHLAITGGEPMMHQDGIIALAEEFVLRGVFPRYITIETNCTVPLTEEFKKWIEIHKTCGGEVLFSCSPKLETVSGDKPEVAHRPDVIKQYFDTSAKGYFKIVCRGEDRVWKELEERLCEYRKHGILFDEWPVWVMPVGSDAEGQSISAGDVANEAAQRGYRVSSRAHIQWFGNEHCT